MPDIKFADDRLAEKYTRSRNYFTVARQAVKEMHRQVGDLKTDKDGLAYKGLMIRHLVLPDNLAGTDRIMAFIAQEISKDTYVNIMSQHYPAYRAVNMPHLDRRITNREYNEALDTAEEWGLTRVEGF